MIIAEKTAREKIMAITVYKSGKNSWRIVLREFKDGKRIAKAISKESYHAFGFNSNWTIEEARIRAKQLTSQKLAESKRQINISKKIDHQRLINKAYLPNHIVVEFEEHLRILTFGTQNRIKTIMHHWSTCQIIISKFEIDPKDFYESRFKIYEYFISKKYSLDYISKLIRILNLWGHFISKYTNSFYQQIPKPTVNESARITEARENKKGVRTEALPLTISILENAKTKFELNNLIAQWNWLYISMWFGLRPSETDRLKIEKNIRIEKINGIESILIYQTKLTNLSKEKRWKPIPIFFDEQKKALAIIKSGIFKRPLAKTIAKYIDEGYDNYSPRKGFTDLMLEKGFALEDISLFLGHNSIDTTWKHYKNKFIFKLPIIEKKGA